MPTPVPPPPPDVRPPDPRAARGSDLESRWEVYFELLRMRVRRRLFMLVSNERRIRWLREDGMRIGEGCWIQTPYFSTEPYLIELGDRVAISSGVEFITHDASSWVFQPLRTDLGLYGSIRVGSGTYIGLKCLILPATSIGENCIIGAGSVVRGNIPDDSVVFGNPATVVMKTPLMKQLILHSKRTVDTSGLTSRQRRELLTRVFGMDRPAGPSAGGPPASAPDAAGRHDAGGPAPRP